jgi:hypothetical protein
MSGVASVGLACDFPALVAIPAKKDVAGKEAQIRAEAAQYFEAMRVYTTCVQAELSAAGGNAAPPITRGVLVARNNFAVAEAEAVMKIFTANVGLPEGGTAPETPAAEGGRERRGRN